MEVAFWLVRPLHPLTLYFGLRSCHRPCLLATTCLRAAFFPPLALHSVRLQLSTAQMLEGDVVERTNDIVGVPVRTPTLIWLLLHNETLAASSHPNRSLTLPFRDPSHRVKPEAVTPT